MKIAATSRRKTSVQGLTRHATRAFGIIEVCLAILGIGLFLIQLFIIVPVKQRTLERQLRDSTQLRTVQQGLVVWANNNKDLYPLPSQIDVDPRHQTSAGVGREKDTTRNIVSLLLYTQCFSDAECVSPAEVNAGIKIDKGYSYVDAPVAMGDPKRALWDPTFAAYPDDALASVKPIARKGGVVATGGFSYAHAIPFGGRSKMWTNSFNQAEAAVGNRGPTYRFGRDDWVLSPSFAKGGMGKTVRGTKSNTLRIHGGAKTWEGNIAYNDNHVTFETEPAPKTLPFTFGVGVKSSEFPDNLFVAERNDSVEREAQAEDLSTSEGMTGRDNYLRGYVDVIVNGEGVERIVPFFD